MLKVQLIHPSLPALVVDPDPEGLEDLELSIKRSEMNDGVFFEFSLNLSFNKAARSFIHTVEDLEGIDGEITCNIYQYQPNTYKNEILYTGQIKLLNFKIGETTVESNIEQSGFERDFLNLSERDLDIESLIAHNGNAIPATPVIDLEYHSKAILKRLDISPIDEEEAVFPGLIFFEFPACATIDGCDRVRSGTVYGNIDGGDSIARELEDNFTYSWGFTAAPILPGEVYLVKEEGIADIDISVHLRHRVTANLVGGKASPVGCGSENLGQIEIRALYIHQAENGAIKVFQPIGTEWEIPVCPGLDTFLSEYELKTYQENNVVLELGDKISVFYLVQISATYVQPFGTGASTLTHELGVQAIKEDTFIRITQRTVFPPTFSKSVLVYEVANKMCQYMTGQEDCFRSPFFGRTDTVVPYLEDGKGSLIAFSNGENIRSIDSTIFMNWVDLFQTMTSMYCLGWGFERLENGTQVVVCDEKPYFYNKNIKILTLGQVTDAFRIQDISRYYGVVKYGWPKLKNIKQINGIDEFNTPREQSSPLSKTKGTLDIRIPYRGSGFETEQQRRLKNSDEDSPLDSEIFVLAVIRDGGGFKTESDENFIEINNVFDPQTVYNARITPARNLINWSKILGSNLIKSERKEFLFSSGDLNYLMTSQMTGGELIAENENLNVLPAIENNEVLYYPEIYEFESKFTKENFKLLLQNPKGYVSFEDWNGNKLEGYVLDISYKMEENKATIELLRLYRK